MAPEFGAVASLLAAGAAVDGGVVVVAAAAAAVGTDSDAMFWVEFSSFGSAFSEGDDC